MAGQAHYTSAPPGVSGRYGGFRFTAVSPAARPALEMLRPLTAGTAPPGAEGPGDFPAVLAYDRPTEDRAVWTLTRFTGRDYSGRSGNRFCHVLVAAPAELTGLRPVDLWDSPHWAAVPAADDGHDLPDLARLEPGRTVGPDRVSRLLQVSGEPGARLLERLLAETLRALAGEGPGVTLVSEDPSRVLDWITAVCYALPAGLAARLTFTTYTARPQDERRHLAGTLPQTAGRARGPVLPLGPACGTARAGGLPPAAVAPACPAARFLARAWADGDLDALDTAADLWEAAPRDGTSAEAAAEGVRGLRAACALLDAGPAREPEDRPAGPDGTADDADCRAGGEVPSWLDRFAAAGRTLPESAQRRLAGRAVPFGLPVAVRLASLAPAVREQVRQEVEAALADGAVTSAAPGDGEPGGKDGRLTGFVRALTGLRLPDVRVRPEAVRDAAARHLLRPAGHGAPAPLGDVRAALDALPEPYRGAVVAGLLAALEDSPDLRAAALDAQLCAFLADEGLDPLREDGDTRREADPLAAAPRTALHVLRRAAGPDPARAARRVLRLYRAGLLTETETYDAVRELACADVPQRASRLPWRRGGARGKE
ncbi:hypothetical protein GCM10010512_01410 [Streptomyces thermoviolaceus subsp. thermoviolaceus]|uniref:Uncharacterized protein n=1 Tax=Streptomyces thermoviolaceus subsp. thermoviolaceus TaxID=66860 RepID=A0ABX0Z037_STRTL|nr:hypothetical protein [Streptomyces thermoviolaceus]NJP16595.1 hypothetical protein [Streptomyces thermoviolaceus subsp. thermoviolaceus]WTD46151.1 hypothetical protein OG899_00640 [Streptomyces thermoviolaceus]GHA74864.1 hypothetical protein GCM10010512_01410 [Streptomyces thermoviolaceus subsp. thermoviolaceus]